MHTVLQLMEFVVISQDDVDKVLHKLYNRRKHTDTGR